MNEVVFGLLRRLRLARLERYHDATVVLGLFKLVNGFVSIALMAVATLATGVPFVFPSLGPTAFLFFFTPTAPAAAPRNTVASHLIGALAGWGSLSVFGLTAAPPALAVGVDWPRVGAAALSLDATSDVMISLRVPPRRRGRPRGSCRWA